MASTIARNEPEMPHAPDLDGEHVAADGEHEQQPDELERLPVVGDRDAATAATGRDAAATCAARISP